MNELQELKAKYEAAKLDHAAGILSTTSYEDICIDIGHETEGCCEGCFAPLFPDDPYHNSDAPTCAECAPTFQDLVDEPESFLNNDDGEPSDPELLRAIFDHHIANGGSPDDKLIGDWGKAYADAQNKCAAAEDMYQVLKQALLFLLDIARQNHPNFKPEMADEDSIIGRTLKALAKAEGRANG